MPKEEKHLKVFKIIPVIIFNINLLMEVMAHKTDVHRAAVGTGHTHWVGCGLIVSGEAGEGGKGHALEGPNYQDGESGPYPKHTGDCLRV